jgi:ADP-ribose pyrophosphatase
MSSPSEAARVLSRQRIYEGRVVTLDVDQIEEPGGHRSAREVIRHGGSVAVLPVHADGSVSLVRQFRHPARGAVWEVCAGLLEQGESPEAAARRELEEETGLVGGTLEPLVAFHVSPGYSEEFVSLFRATLHTQGPQRPDGDERIEVRAFSLERARAMVADGQIHDAKTILAILLEGERRLA